MTQDGMHMSEHMSRDESGLAVREDGFELVSVIVEYDDRPDQCTIYNPDTTGVERMSSWITAERACLVDLDFAR